MPISTKPSNAVKADAGKITKTLRWLARETEFVFAAEQLNAAAALIESMQAQLAVRDAEIERLREAQRWIPVSERLPEYSPSGTVKSYLVAYDTSKGKQMQIAVYSDYMYSTLIGIPPCVTWRDYESHKIKNVTHWMTLPEPPKEG